MKRRVIRHTSELLDENAEIVYEEVKPTKISKAKTLKQAMAPEVDLKKYIKGDPESKGKSESQIEKELETFFNTLPECAWWNTKVKGEIQSTGKETAVMKSSENVGFSDYLLCLKGIAIFVEAKACGRYQSHYQVLFQDKVQKKGGGFYFIVTSVRELVILMLSCGLIKEKK